jgi:pSer/pThr/pTyr-binding forkhead associated (FHA) protein
VICDRCGRNNPENLAFCQDCGRRLASQAAIVPPTPPTGLGVIPLPAEFPGDAGVAQRLSRPEAPQFTFDPPREDEGPVCPACNSRNPVGNRFCVSCGSRLPAVNATPVAAQPAPAGRAQAAPVAPATQPARIVCSRCNGANDASMFYCQFCGASLRSDARAGVPGPAPVANFGAQPARPSVQPDGYGPAQDPRAGQFAATAQSAGTEPAGRLVTIARDGAEGATYPLSGDSIDIGREEGAIQLREDAYVSPRHMRLIRREHGWYAKDLGSLNGIYLRLRKPHALLDGDLLLVGLQVLRFEAVRDAEQGFGPATQHGTLLFGSPMLPRYGRLCERTVEGVTRNVFYLHRDESIIGRESGDIVFTDDPFMSRRHLSIRLDGATATFTATDLGSSNGTYIAIRGEVPLGHGDFLRVGQHLFRVDLVASRPPPAGGPAAGGIRRGP